MNFLKSLFRSPSFSARHPSAATPDTPRSFIRSYYPAFNGLRGLAILMVFINHYGGLVLHERYAMMFWPGVDLFFVLSGFLITGILYDSKQHSDYFTGFYIRRALRIFPLYYGFFLAILVLTPLLKLSYPATLWSFLAYMGNILLIDNRNVLIASRNPTVIQVGVLAKYHAELTIGHLWSLCVEEQFYLVWPLILWLLPSRKAMMWFSAIAIVAALCLRVAMFFHDPLKVAQTHYIYYLPWTRCEGLFAGSWIALWLRNAKLTSRRIRQIAYPLIGIGSSIVIFGARTVGKRWFPNEVNPLVCTYGYTLIAGIAVGVVLLALDETSWVHRLLLNKALGKLGIVSYGFYFIHELYNKTLVEVILSLAWKRRTNFLAIIAIFVLTYIVAWLSFHYFESPFLRLKKKLAPGHRSVPSGREEAIQTLI